MTMRESIARKMATVYPIGFEVIPQTEEQALGFYRRLLDAALAALAESTDTATMDGSVMNAMCEAFNWPETAGTFPNPDGLTECCARSVKAFVSAAREGK